MLLKKKKNYLWLKEEGAQMDDWVIKPLKAIFRQPTFIVCVALLVLSSWGIHSAADQLKWHFRKEPVPLKKPIDQLDVAKLSPYKLVRSITIPDDIVSELGTKDYIQWNLENASLELDDPFRYVTVFVTYYTGNPDKVPHVPDVCYVGSGGLVEAKDNTEFNITGVGAKNNVLPFRWLEVRMRENLGYRNRVVGYFFSVNGTYRSTRRQVQMLQNNIQDRYAYFCKVEVFFTETKSKSRDEVLEKMEQFVQVFLPVLHSDHLPDWEALISENNGS